MKILVLSKEAWRDDENGGNVLSNIFNDFDAEFAQIYCTSKEPNNKICKLYYQMSDKMMVNNILKHKHIGRIMEYAEIPNNSVRANEDYSSVQRLHLDIVRVAREIIWFLAKWNTIELRQFAKDFNPDLIFAPCYGNHYMLRLTRIIANELSVPVVSYISDDFYGNKQFHFSPIYWMNHFLLRKHVRETFPLYKLVYTMTDEQKLQCEKEFNASMKVLRKSGTFADKREKKTVNHPIRLVYGGGIYLNRWKTLCSLAVAIKEINKNGVKMTMDIYTGSQVNRKAAEILNDGINSRMHNLISMAELRNIYAQSDIALHVEGFDIKNRWSVRLSFSTKIVDCLDSDCAVMAICDKKQAGFAYLKRNNAAICIDNPKDIYNVLKKICNTPEIINEYRKQAWECGKRNHQREEIQRNLYKDFEEIINENCSD